MHEIQPYIRGKRQTGPLHLSLDGGKTCVKCHLTIRKPGYSPLTWTDIEIQWKAAAANCERRSEAQSRIARDPVNTDPTRTGRGLNFQGTPLTPEQAALVCKMAAAGDKAEIIGEAVGKTKRSILGYCSRNTIKLQKPGRPSKT